MLVVTLLFGGGREGRGRFLVNNSEASFPKEIDSFERRRVWALIYNDDQDQDHLLFWGLARGAIAGRKRIWTNVEHWERETERQREREKE